MDLEEGPCRDHHGWADERTRVLAAARARSLHHLHALPEPLSTVARTLQPARHAGHRGRAGVGHGGTGAVPESRAPGRVAAYEYDRIYSTFPHVSSEEAPGDNTQVHNAWGFDQSRVDAAVMALAYEVIDEFELGQSREQDYLAISLSATDRVGHAFGPFSQEQLSNLIHVDRILGEFFDYLDEEVGEDKWLIGLAGDHGVVTIPKAQVEMGTNPDAGAYPGGGTQCTARPGPAGCGAQRRLSGGHRRATGPAGRAARARSEGVHACGTHQRRARRYLRGALSQLLLRRVLRRARVGAAISLGRRSPFRGRRPGRIPHRYQPRIDLLVGPSRGNDLHGRRRRARCLGLTGLHGGLRTHARRTRGHSRSRRLGQPQHLPEHGPPSARLTRPRRGGTVTGP
ncbi:MAG TPA: hypothetical protein DC060_00025 [Gemmatimonadetes bacterium]|nr:hypothetical protein [Gemmatimonadota bacterium]